MKQLLLTLSFVFLGAMPVEAGAVSRAKFRFDCPSEGPGAVKSGSECLARAKATYASNCCHKQGGEGLNDINGAWRCALKTENVECTLQSNIQNKKRSTEDTFGEQGTMGTTHYSCSIPTDCTELNPNVVQKMPPVYSCQEQGHEPVFMAHQKPTNHLDPRGEKETVYVAFACKPKSSSQPAQADEKKIETKESGE